MYKCPELYIAFGRFLYVQNFIFCTYKSRKVVHAFLGWFSFMFIKGLPLFVHAFWRFLYIEKSVFCTYKKRDFLMYKFKNLYIRFGAFWTCDPAPSEDAPQRPLNLQPEAFLGCAGCELLVRDEVTCFLLPKNRQAIWPKPIRRNFQKWKISQKTKNIAKNTLFA